MNPTHVTAGNAFKIPEKSSILENNKRIFRAKPKRFPRNLPEISLKGSSKNLMPAMMKGPSK